AVLLVAGLYDQFGYDSVDNSPLSESWRSGPGTPVWHQSLLGGQGREALARNLAAAVRSSAEGRRGESRCLGPRGDGATTLRSAPSTSSGSARGPFDKLRERNAAE